MCGFIAAFSESIDLERPVRRAMDQLHRRGPDAEALWQEPGVCLGHRRLAIIDLDARAGQPMHSACGRYVLVYNGEIYNFSALRDGLGRQGVEFRTTSDTEVILTLFAAEGPAMLPRLHGMFTLVIWDRVTRRAFVARDPYGIKPLYCAVTADGVILASQVKALLATGRVAREPSPQGQLGFWLLGSVPEPHTWFRDITAIPSGHYGWIEGGHLTGTVCWSDIGRHWRNAPLVPLPDAEVRAQVRTAVRESVARHMVADVPVGVFLSGGIDSGVLAAMMSEAGRGRIEGVTIAYDEFEGSHEDEAPVAARIAAQYGIRHHVRRVTREEFIADLPRIIEAMDQPSIDGINTWYASKAAAECGLKVVVSGVGGDELFQGYESFTTLPRLVRRWSALARIPGISALGRLAGGVQARRSGNDRWRHAAQWARSIGGAWWLRRSLNAPEAIAGIMGDRRAAGALEGFDAERRVRSMCGALATDSRLALGQIESMTYLRNQLLRDSDWASMDHSVELRTPLVDAHLLQSLQPVLASFSRFPAKRLLAECPNDSLPPEILHRRKTGFGIPMGRWLDSSADRTVLPDSRAWARRLVAAFTPTTEPTDSQAR